MTTLKGTFFSRTTFPHTVPSILKFLVRFPSYASTPHSCSCFFDSFSHLYSLSIFPFLFCPYILCKILKCPKFLSSCAVLLISYFSFYFLFQLIFIPVFIVSHISPAQPFPTLLIIFRFLFEISLEFFSYWTNIQPRLPRFLYSLVRILPLSLIVRSQLPCILQI